MHSQIIKSTFTNIVAIAALCISTTALALPVSLDAAEDFSQFIFNDYAAANSHTEGRVAVGGEADIKSYSINGKSVGNPALVVGEKLKISNAKINGDVEVAGKQSIKDSAISGSISDSVSVDFASTEKYFVKLSSDISQLAATGKQSNSYGELTYQGSGANSQADTQTFNLTESEWKDAQRFGLTDVDNSDTIIFNIAGKKMSFSSNGSYAGGNEQPTVLQDFGTNILYNFYEATKLELAGSIWGSILAPRANISCNSGQINGQVIASAWSCGKNSITSNYLPFNNTKSASLSSTKVTEVSEPASLAMLFTGLAGIVMVRRKAR